MLLSGVQTFGDSFGSLQRSSGDGTTLDFSAVTGSLVFTISGDSVTVSYADTNHADLLTYSADGQDYAIVGSQGSDDFFVVNDGQLESINGAAGDDTIRFDSTTGVVPTGSATIVTRSNSSPYSVTGIENFSNAGLSIPGFVNLNGNFSLQSYVQTVTLDDGTLVTANVQRIGGHDVTAFAGLNGGSADQLGLSLNGVDFAEVVVTDQADASRSWTAFKANAGSIAITGLPSITASSSDLTVEVNRPAGDGTLIDFSVQPLEVATGPGSSKTLDMDGHLGSLDRAFGQVTLDVAGFFHVVGDFAFEKSIRTVTLSNGQSVAVDMLSLGGTDVDAFAGLNGGSSEAVGLNLSGVDFGVALMASRADHSQKFTAVSASAQNVGFVGLNDLAVSGENIAVAINRSSGASDVVVDFAASPVTIPVGNGTQTLAIDGKLGAVTQVSGHLSLGVANFMSVEGDFAIRKSESAITLSDHSQLTTDLLTVGATGVTAFAGLNGGTPDAIGFGLSGLEFGLVMASQKIDNEPDRQWMALKATADSAGFYGSDAFEASGTNMKVEITRPAVDGTFIDLFADPLTVRTGTVVGSTITLDMDSSAGPVTRLEGNVNLNVDGFFQVSGGFHFEKTTGEVTVAQPLPAPGSPPTTTEPETVSVDQLLIGASHVDAFVGLNGGTADQLGLRATDVSFALALNTDMLDHRRQWTSLSATAGNVSFVGIDGVTVSASNVEVDINHASQGEVLDFSTNPLNVPTGPGESLDLTMNGALGELVRAKADMDVNLFDFFSVNGSFEFVKSRGTVKLSDGSTINADLVTLGGADVTAFAGIKFEDQDKVGLSLGGANFGLALIVDQANHAHHFTSLQATADSAAFNGLDILNIAASDLQVAVNRGVIVPATPGSTTTTNTIYDLNLFAGTIGTLTFSYGGDSETLAVTGTEGNLVLRQRIALTIANLTGIGANNVEVTGDKTNGFKIEYIGALAGHNVEGLTVTITAPAASSNVTQTVSSNAGQTEIKYLTITDQPVPTLPITSSVVTTVPVQQVETPPTLTKTNTVYDVAIGSGTLGTVTFSFAGKSISFTLTGTESDADIRTKIATAVGGLRGIGSANVSVTGSKPSSFHIELNGQLAGINVTGLTVSITPPNATSNVTTAINPIAGLSEIQTVTFTTPPPPLLTSTVVTTNVAKLGTGDVFAIEFTTPYASKQFYQLHLGRKTEQLRFVNNDVDNNARYLSEGLAKLLGTTKDNVSVLFDQTTVGMHRYYISLKGDLKGQSIQGLSVTNTFEGGGTVRLLAPDAGVSGKYAHYFRNKAGLQVENLSISTRVGTSGSPENSETQRVTINSSAGQTGLFTLTFTNGGIAYKTTTMPLNADASSVQAALNKAVAGLAGAKLTVTCTVAGEWYVTFGGSLAGRDVQPLKVDAEANSSVGSGTFTLTANGQQTGPINFSSDSTTLANNIQLALAANSTIGAGNVSVTFEGGSLGPNTNKFHINYINGKATTEVGNLSANGGGLTNVQIAAGNRQEGKASVAERQTVTLTTAAQTGSFVLSVKIGATTYSTAAIDLNANQATINAALTSAFSTLAGANAHVFSQTGRTFDVEFGGTLAGQNINLLNVAITPTTAAATINRSQDGSTTVTPATPSVVGIGSETQRVMLDGNGQTGHFSLSFQHNNVRYTTTDLPFDASSSAAEAALNTALSSLSGASLTVTSSANTTGIWDVTFGGSLEGEDVDLLQLKAVADVPETRGTFTIEVGGEVSAPITDSANYATLAANIVAALEPLAAIGSGNVSVSFVDSLSSETARVFRVNFLNARALENIPDFTADSSDLILASVRPTRQQHGAAPTAEEQRVALITKATNGSFTLGLTYNGTTYTTDRLPLGAEEIAINAALAAAFTSLAGADVHVGQWTRNSFSVVFGGSLAGQDVGNLDVTVTATTVAPELTQAQTGETVTSAGDPEKLLVVDYAAQPLVVPTGGTPIMLTMNGADGELTEASGHLVITVTQFLTIEGDLAFRRADSQVHVLGEVDPVDVSLLTIGGKNLTAFAGINGGTSDAVGLTLSGLEFGIAYAQQHIANAPDRKWLSAKATAAEAGFVGSNVLQVTGTDLTVEITRPASADDSYLDLANHPIDVRTGSGQTDKLTLDLDSSHGSVTRVEGTLNVQVGEFFQTLGTYHIDRSQAELVESGPVGDTYVPEPVDLLTIGASHVSAFIGLNGGTSNALGFQATEVGFGLMIATSQADPERKWTALKATAGSVTFVGIDNLTMNSSNVEVDINTASPGEEVLDLAAAPLVILTGGAPVTLDFDGDKGEMVRARANIDIDLFDVFQVNGAFELNKSSDHVTLSDGDEIDVDLLTIGGSNVSAFTGVSGGTSDALGFSLTGVNFALALMTDQADASRAFTTLQADANGASLIGIDDLTVASSDLRLAINRGITVPTKPEVVTKINAVYDFNLFNDTIGTVTFHHGTDRADLVLRGNEGDVTLRSSIALTIGSLNGIGANNVQVTGSKLGGFQVGFIGALAGTAIDDFTVTTTAAAATTTVKQLTPADAGQSEIKYITIEAPRPPEPNVQTTVEQVEPFTLGGGAVYALRFTDPSHSTTAPQSHTGRYDLTIGGTTIQNVNFVQTDLLNNARYIRRAFGDALGLTAGAPAGSNANQIDTYLKRFISVRFDKQLLNQHRYFISFLGSLTNQPIGPVTATEHFNVGDVIVETYGSGTPATGEVQRVRLDANGATGTFHLQLNDQGTFKTDAIPFNATAAVVQAKLDAVLGNNQVIVTGNPGDWFIEFTGSRVGCNINEFTVFAVPDLPPTAGSFTISVGGETSAPINYSASHSTQAANIQAALNAFNAVGAGNSTVVFDAAKSTQTAAVYRIDFIAARALENIPDFSTNSSGLLGGRALPSREQHGRAPSSETQQVVLITNAKSGSFTLALTQGGQTYTTTALDLDADQAAVQSALNAAISGLTGATISVTFWNGKQLEVSFGGTLTGVDVAPLTAIITPTVAAATLTQKEAGNTLVDPEIPARTLVVDFAAQPLVVPTGGTPITLNMDGQRGEITEAGGHLNVGLSDFATAQGSFLVTFESHVTGTITNEKLTVSGTDISAFVGTAQGTVDEAGVKLEDGSFGLVAYQNHDTSLTTQADPTYAFTTTGTASLVGISGLTASGTLTARVNHTGAAVDEEIPTLGDPIELKFADGVDAPQVFGSATLSIGGFVDVSGDFTFEKNSSTVGTVTTTTITAAAANLDVFIGIGGGADVVGVKSPVGVLIKDTTLGVIFETKVDSTHTLPTIDGYAVSVTGAAELIGVEGLSLTGTLTAKVNTTGHAINQTINVPDQDGGADIPVTIAFANGQNTPTFIGDDVTLNIANLINMTADVRIEKQTVGQQTVLLLGAEHISAFLGVNGVGLTLSNGTLGAVLTSDGPAGTQGGYAIKGSGTVGLTGGGLEDIGLTGTVNIEVNKTGAAVNQTVLQRTGPVTPVIFTDATTISRISPPTNFDITLNDQTFVTDLFHDLAGQINDLNRNFDVTVDKSGNRTAASSLVEVIPGTDLTIDDLLGAKKLTGAGKFIDYYLAYQTYLTELDAYNNPPGGIPPGGSPTGQEPQAPANPGNLPDPGNLRSGANGSITAGQSTFTAVGGRFTSDLVGKTLSFVDGNGQTVGAFTIASVTNGNTLQLNSPAGQTVAEQAFVIRGTPIAHPGSPTLRGLLAYLNNFWISTISANPADGINLTLTNRGVGLSVAIATAQTKSTKLHFGDAFDEYGLKFNSDVTIDFDVHSAIDVTLGVDWVDKKARFDVNTLAMTAKAHTDFIAAATFGPIAVSVGSATAQQGSIDVDLGGSISYVNGGFTFKPQKNGFDAVLPVYAALAGVDLTNGPTPIARVSGGFFNKVELKTGTTGSVAAGQKTFTATGTDLIGVIENGTSGSVAANKTTLTATGSNFTGAVKDKFVSILDSSGNIVETFGIKSVTNGTTLELKTAPSTAITNRPFVVHELDLRGKFVSFNDNNGVAVTTYSIKKATNSTTLELTGAADTGFTNRPFVVYENKSGFTFEQENFDKLFDFKSLTVAQVIQMFPDFRDYLADEVTNSDSLLTLIPFVQTGLNEVLRFADAFNDRVYSKINFDLPRVDLKSGTNGNLAKDQKVFTASGAGFTNALQNKFVSFLDGDGKIVATFGIKTVTNSTTLELQTTAAADFSNRPFVVHEELQRVQTLQQLTQAVNAAGNRSRILK